MHPDAVTSFVHARRVVMAVPDVRHDDRRFAEVKALSEGVVAAVMDDSINLRNDRGLRKPLVEDDVGRDICVLVEISADVDQCTQRQLAEGVDQAPQSRDVDAAQLS